MLRSPTHVVGHCPTSAHHANSTTTTTSNSMNSQYHHHHHGQNSNAVTSQNIHTNDVLNSTSTSQATTRSSLFDSCHRKIRLIGGGPVAFLGGLVAKARRKERDGDQSSTDSKLYLEESVLERKLPDADLKALVDLPPGLDYNEWLASHTLALFEHVNLVYGTISEFCTTSGCPDMTGPGNRTYLWFDEKGKKTRVAAPQYIDYVMTFTQKTVSDESIFPTKYANEFPSSFESIARKILRWQFHVIAHLYAAHFREIALLGLHTHLNLTFAHLTALHRRFNLIDEKETDVLRDLEVALRLNEDSTGYSGNSPNTASALQFENSGSSVSGSSGSTSQSGVRCGWSGRSERLLHGLGGANEDSSLLNCGIAGRIDGDSMIQPICTQPEAKKTVGNDQSDIRSSAVGGGGDTVGYFKAGIGGGGGHGLGSVLNFNNNHTAGLASNNILQCNNSRSSNNSSHTTTTA